MCGGSGHVGLSVWIIVFAISELFASQVPTRCITLQVPSDKMCMDICMLAYTVLKQTFHQQVLLFPDLLCFLACHSL